MLWSLPKRRIKDHRVVIRYADVSQNNAKDAICNQLGGPVYLENVESQSRSFSKFIGEKYIPEKAIIRSGLGLKYHYHTNVYLRNVFVSAQSWAEGPTTRQKAQFGGLLPPHGPRLCWQKASINRVNNNYDCKRITLN